MVNRSRSCHLDCALELLVLAAPFLLQVVDVTEYIGKCPHAGEERALTGMWTTDDILKKETSNYA